MMIDCVILQLLICICLLSGLSRHIGSEAKEFVTSCLFDWLIDPNCNGKSVLPVGWMDRWIKPFCSIEKRISLCQN